VLVCGAGAVPLVRQVLLALTCIHHEQIVHSDLKGENILIADDDTPRICDFEMSKSLDTYMSFSLMGGSPGFMCPAVLGGRAALSTASDIYSFGVVILNTMCPPEVSPNG
jgi:serine/threonine protein kinase